MRPDNSTQSHPATVLAVHQVFFAKSSDLGLISAVCYSILSHMKTTSAKSPRTRAKIIAELASLPSAIQGKICEDKRKLADGTTAVYHNLQYWANGRNHTIRIPRDKLPAFREAVKGGATAKRLLAELAKVDAEAILSAESTLKKARAPRPEGRRGSTTSSTRPRAPSSATASPARRSSSRRSSTR